MIFKLALLALATGAFCLGVTRICADRFAADNRR
jgi:hypothetical protein